MSDGAETRAASSPSSVATARAAHPVFGRLGLSLATVGAGMIAALTLVALLLGAWPFVWLGVNGIVCCGAIGVGAFWPRLRRRALLALAVAVALAAPLLLPIPRGRREGALIRSVSVFGGEPGTPWLSLIDEETLVRAGEGVGWQSPERETLARRGGVWKEYARFEPLGLFERGESVVLDSWLFDRGHYFLALPERDPAGARAPLIVFMHGNGGNFRPFPAWLAPRAAARGIATAYPTWGFGDWDAAGIGRVIAAIDDAAGRFAVDPGRVVLVGLSAGGIGAVRVQNAHPDRFDAVVTISGAPSGGFDPVACARTPFLVIHGERDGHLPVTVSLDLAESIARTGGQAELDLWEKADHTLLLVHRDAVIERILDWSEAHLGR